MGLSTPARGASLTAQLDRDTVPLGETVTLSLTFEGVRPPRPPNLPALTNLNSLGVSQSSSVTILNGQRSDSYTYSYTLGPTATGEVQIPAMQVNIGGQTLTSQPLNLRVVQATAGGVDGGLSRYAFLRLVAPKTEVYVGEVFPVEIHLYFQNAQDVRMPQLSAPGFSLGQSAKPAQTVTQVNGVGYNLVTFRMSATAAKSGDLTFGPAECALTVLVPRQQNRRRDPFDFDSFFGPRADAKPTTLTSETIPMRVLPLPTQNVPDSFNGAVGQFSMRVTAGPTNVAVGDPVTVRVQLTGNGALDALTLPPQTQWGEFKAYPPTSSVETSDPLGLSGTKTFEQVVIPQNHEIKALPPVRFSYFDVGQRSYRTLTHAPIPLVVRRSATRAAPPMLTNGSPGTVASPPVDDIVHIRARLDTTGPPPALLAQQPWFLSLQALPVLTWLSLLAWRKRSESLARNPKLRRQREVDARVREGLRELRGQADRQEADAFFATLFRLLQERLGERLDLPASAITEAVIEERLNGRELPRERLEALHELFQTCNQARYAPLKSGQELASLIPKVEVALRDLEKLRS
jgi:hypothetical protein